MPSNQLFTDWVSGDLITASKLNQMKNDLAALAGPTFLGEVINNAGVSAGGTRHFTLRTSGGGLRHSLGLLGTEIGGNVGSDFLIFSYSDAGAYLRDAFRLERSTGRGFLNNNEIWHAGNDGKGSGLHTDIISARAARVYKTSSQSILNNTDTTLSWDAEAYDTDNFHDNATNNSRLVAPRTGKYLITANIQWAAGGANTSRVVRFKINGAIDANVDVDYANSNGNSVYQSPSTVVLLNSGDYVEVVVNQNSGATSAVFGQTNQDTSFTLTYLGD